LIEKRSFKSELDMNEFILESFNTDKEAEINNFSIKFNINNSSLILEEVNLKINDLNAWLKGKFNFYNKNYNASFKISIDDIDNKFILLNLEHDNGLENISIKNNYYLNNNIALNDPKKDPDNQVNSTSEINVIEDFNTIVNDLNKENLLEIKEDNVIKTATPQSYIAKVIEEDKSFNKVIESNIKLSKLPKSLKDIKQPLPINYFKPKIIVNTITKPKLPSEEDLLDNLLDSVLNP